MANIRLTVVIPDPGEWCWLRATDKACWKFDETIDGERVCQLGFRLDHATYRRPPECHAAQCNEESHD